MTREKFVGRLLVVIVLVMFAAIAGEVRRVSNEANSVEDRFAKYEDDWESVEPSRSGKYTCGGRFEIVSEPEVLVRFKAGVTPEEIKGITDEFNDVARDHIEAVKGLTVIDDLDDRTPAEVAAEYSSLSEVLYAEPNYEINLEEPPSDFNRSPRMNNPVLPFVNDPYFGEQWALDNTGQSNGKAGVDVRALEAWKQTRGSHDTLIAVLDSGVDYNHADLAANMWTRPASVAVYEDDDLGVIDDAHGYNAVDNNGDPMDDNGHGTHCAGIIGAVGNNNIGVAGINWQVQIMPLKFLSKGGFGSTKDAIEAINYVIARRKAGVPVSVISASWGSTQKSKALGEVIQRAREAGILFVAAAGNSSANTDRSPHYPANYAGVISVAALNRYGKLASFSNYGAKTVALAAPGAEILSTWLGNNYFEASGTSMATPYVAGVAGLALAENPNLTVEELRSRLLDTVDKTADLTGKVSSGGRLNAARAVAGK